MPPIQSSCQIKLRAKEMEWNVMYRKQVVFNHGEPRTHYRFNSGWRKVVRGLDIREGDECRFTLMDSKTWTYGLKIKREKPLKNSRNNKGVGNDMEFTVIVEKRDVIRGYFLSLGKDLTQKMPMKMFRDGDKILLLQDDKKMKWKVQYKKRRCYTGFSGWKLVSTENKLQIGEELTFSVVNMDKRVFKLQINPPDID